MTVSPQFVATARLVRRAPRSITLFAVFALVAGLSGLSPNASTAAGLAPDATMPAELTATDIAAYQQIFTLQEAGNWSAADALIETVENPILMGHVRFQRYMHPTAYRSNFSELSHWLEHYGDIPNADRIYRLAVRRKPASAAAPLAPTRPHTNGASDLGGGATQTSAASTPQYRSPNARTSSEARKVRDAFRHVRGHLRRLDIDHAYQDLLNGVTINGLMDPVERDMVAAMIATGYFYTGRETMALEMAEGIAEGALRYVPEVDWIAGLSAWNLGEFETALTHFERFAEAEGISDRKRAAASFWTARANLVTRRPENVLPWLQRAAQVPYTLYGILAGRQLGLSPGLDWGPPSVSGAEVAVLQGVPAIRRAIALTQIGNDHMADQEIRAVYSAAGFGISKPLLAVASQYGMASAELRISRQVLALDGEAFNGSLYPVPNWQPDGGFDLDRALVFAFVRQESAFNIRARSVDGAHGLMQLMPSTAAFVTGDSSLRGKNSDKLYEQDFNLSLGQQYLQILMDTDHVGSNLMWMVAAYNGGPGNLSKWMRAMGPAEDPLIFMEKIPVRETREFVERVLTNLWMYRARLGQDSPELDALASGAWPQYQSVDGIRQTAFRDAGN